MNATNYLRDCTDTNRTAQANIQPVWLAWFSICSFAGALALANGQTTFFASTVDQVDSALFSRLLLNTPLQLICTIAAIIPARQRARDNHRLGDVPTITIHALIAPHVVMFLVVGMA